MLEHTPMLLILAKIGVSILAVVGLSLVAEHVSPRVAGILSGYPLGTAIALFFIGIENGAQFAADSAVYTLSGFAASLVLVWAYQLSAVLKGRLQVLLCAICGVSAFLVTSTILAQSDLGLLGGLVFTLSVILFFGWLFRHIPDHVVTDRIRFSYAVVAFRAGMAAAIVLLVTGIARWVGPEWAGVLSAFPITLFPFLLIIHLTYGLNQVLTIIKHYPMGLGALVTYAVTVSQTYALWGVGVGTLVGFLAATVYLLVSTQIVAMHKRSQNRTD